MTLKTLLVCLTNEDHADDVMKQAVLLARRDNAHLVGIHALDAIVMYSGLAMHVPEAAYVAISESQNEEAERLQAIFARHTENEDFPSEFRTIHGETAPAGERVVENARAADLVMMAQEDRSDHRDIQIKVIRECGRPVVVVPHGYDGPAVGSNIVVGWSDTREAARAAHDMLIAAEKGAAVTVLRVGRGAQDAMKDFEGIQIAETLDRHGLKISLESRPSDGKSVADVLNQVALEKGADLIVTGALGHSRVYDFVIGATTHALLDGATLPVLFSK